MPRTKIAKEYRINQNKLKPENISKLNDQIIRICDRLCEKGAFNPEENIKISIDYDHISIRDQYKILRLTQFI